MRRRLRLHPFSFRFQRLLDGSRHGIMDLRLAAEADLILCRVDIDIHFLEGNFEEKDHRRVPALHQQRLIALQNRMAEESIPNVAPIYVGQEITGAGKRAGGGAQEAGKCFPSLLGTEKGHGAGDLRSQDLCQAILKPRHRDVVRDQRLPPIKPEMDITIGQGQTVDDIANMA